jgi:hypothetical protein
MKFLFLEASAVATFVRARASGKVGTTFLRLASTAAGRREFFHSNCTVEVDLAVGNSGTVVESISRGTVVGLLRRRRVVALSVVVTVVVATIGTTVAASHFASETACIDFSSMSERQGQCHEDKEKEACEGGFLD